MGILTMLKGVVNVSIENGMGEAAFGRRSAYDFHYKKATNQHQLNFVIFSRLIECTPFTQRAAPFSMTTTGRWYSQSITRVTSAR